MNLDKNDLSRISAVVASYDENPFSKGDGHMTSAQYLGYNVDPEQKPLNNSSRKPSAES